MASCSLLDLEFTTATTDMLSHFALTVLPAHHPHMATAITMGSRSLMVIFCSAMSCSQAHYTWNHPLCHTAPHPQLLSHLIQVISPSLGIPFYHYHHGHAIPLLSTTPNQSKQPHSASPSCPTSWLSWTSQSTSVRMSCLPESMAQQPYDWE